MKNLLTLICVLLLVSSCVVSRGQDGKPGQPGVPGKPATPTVATPRIDQKLADSLGADKMGMRSYMLVILKTGPQDASITDKAQRQELFKGHFSNMTEMEKSGKLKLAGPFSTKNSLGYRGIFLLDVKTEAEAHQLLQNDPTIKSGIFQVEILPWYGSAAIPMHLQFHKKIANESP